jgi:5-methyltetrahydropteroyltriglutamate--homocysteine methyltransferase
MVRSSLLGFPRIGFKRELKKSLEQFWSGEIDANALNQVGQGLRTQKLNLFKDNGIDLVPVNDFSFYDQMLDMSLLLGVIPERFREVDSTNSNNGLNGATLFKIMFAIARGSKDRVASEMTKWFDTNYHYIVPEISPDQTFALSTNKIFQEVTEAKNCGLEPKPILIGPVTYLKLAKPAEGNGNFQPLSLLDKILPIYVQILNQLESLGVNWVQIDEPILSLDLTTEEQLAITRTYLQLGTLSKLKIIVANYFGELRDNLPLFLNLPVKGIHVDGVRGRSEILQILSDLAEDKVLSLGLVDGRSIWLNDLSQSLDLYRKAISSLGEERVIVSSSCSLLHSPVSLRNESIDPEIRSWMSFAEEKVKEIAVLTAILNGKEDGKQILAENAAVLQSKKVSSRVNNPQVREKVAAIKDADFDRKSSFASRQPLQRAAFNLPLFPTTTIGSFPQTKEVREARAQLKRGAMSELEYEKKMQELIVEAINIQEELDIDMLVHGEFERNDMVEYFGEQLEGFIFSKNGWVQSYGSRCVKPPIIFGDVSRPKAMTVAWSSFAQSKTKRPMKGMLTGPITMLQWSFVRDDLSRKEVAFQIALSLRDEVCDLEKAGIKAIQIDEPALREGLPLRRSDWSNYLDWAVSAFRLSAAGVSDTTQIHTHMCYSEFNDIIQAIADLDADVISIETSRSKMELLDAFVKFKYPNEIGPGVYDIHSPWVPQTDDMLKLLQKAKRVIPPQNLWVNPDCGLKTRGWPETRSALAGMVAAAKRLRAAEGASSSEEEAQVANQ